MPLWAFRKILSRKNCFFVAVNLLASPGERGDCIGVLHCARWRCGGDDEIWRRKRQKGERGMCFRPAEVGVGPVECPSCGKRVNPTNGVLPKKCPFCKTEMDTVSEPGAPAAPAAPVAPAAPKAPVAPEE